MNLMLICVNYFFNKINFHLSLIKNRKENKRKEKMKSKKL